MDIFSLIHQEHESLLTLIQTLDRGAAEAMPSPVFAQFDTLLERHLRAERTVLPPILERAGDGRVVARELKGDLSLLEALRKELRSISSVDPRWTPHFEELRDYFREHVAEVEDRVFKKVHKLARVTEWQSLANDMIRAAGPATREAA